MSGWVGGQVGEWLVEQLGEWLVGWAGKWAAEGPVDGRREDWGKSGGGGIGRVGVQTYVPASHSPPPPVVVKARDSREVVFIRQLKVIGGGRADAVFIIVLGLTHPLLTPRCKHLVEAAGHARGRSGVGQGVK